MRRGVHSRTRRTTMRGIMHAADVLRAIDVGPGQPDTGSSHAEPLAKTPTCISIRETGVSLAIVSPMKPLKPLNTMVLRSLRRCHRNWVLIIAERRDALRQTMWIFLPSGFNLHIL